MPHVPVSIRPVQELLVQQHLFRWNRQYQYNEVRLVDNCVHGCFASLRPARRVSAPLELGAALCCCIVLPRHNQDGS